VNLLAAQVAAHQTGAAAECYRQLRRRGDLTDGERAAAAALYACLGLDDLPTKEVRRAAAEALDRLDRIPEEIVIDFLGVGGRDTVEFLAECMTAVALLYDGKTEASARQFESVLVMPGVRYGIWKLYALGGLALARAFDGRCTEARSLATSAITFAEANDAAHFHGLAFAHLALAHVALDRCDWEAMTYHLRESQARAQRTGRTSFLGLQRLFLIEQTAATRGADAALAELRRAERRAGEPPVVVELGRAREVRLLIEEGSLVQARALIANAPAEADAGLCIDLELASRHVELARQLLDHCDRAPGLRANIQRLLRTVAVCVAEGRSESAALVLQEALSLAEREGLRRPFLEQPAAMKILRSEALRGSHAFARTILQVASTTGGRQTGQLLLSEPLTQRECEVLDYLPTRLENKDIASALFVSTNTLKSHLRHIYTKLDVEDRDAAVAAASDLGLL